MIKNFTYFADVLTRMNSLNLVARCYSMVPQLPERRVRPSSDNSDQTANEEPHPVAVVI